MNASSPGARQARAVEMPFQLPGKVSCVAGRGGGAAVNGGRKLPDAVEDPRARSPCHEASSWTGGDASLAAGTGASGETVRPNWAAWAVNMP